MTPRAAYARASRSTVSSGGGAIESGPGVPALTSLLRRARRDDDLLVLLGEVGLAEVPHYYNAADVVVSMARTEGFPNTVLEVMCCRRPLVVGRIVLALLDRAAGTSRVLTESLDAWVRSFRFAPDGTRVYFTADVKGRTPLHALDLGSGKIAVLSSVGLVDAFEVSKDGTWAAVARRRMHLPTELHRVALSGETPGAESALTSQNQALLDEVDFRPMEEVFVDSPSGRKVQVLLVKPHGFDPAKKYPVIVNVHGGPQMQWADAFRGDAQVYPGAGYVVAFPNPFGSVHERTEISYYLQNSSDITITIHDPFGNQVMTRRFTRGQNGARAGLNRHIYWDGRNDQGHRVASGIYVINVIGEVFTGTTFESSYRIGVLW